nr:arylesterase [Tianweitania populi]
MSLSMTGMAASAEPLKIVGFGDSLMAGYQLGPTDSFAAKLEAALKAKGLDVTVANAGVSGDTTAAGLSRIDWSVPEGTQLVVLELGANDMLRGLPPEQTRKNLDTMLKRLTDRGIAVVLAGMMAAPNLGPAYGNSYNSIFPDLAKKYNVPLVPFFLDGVVGVSGLQIDDGIHPNPKGVDVMVERSLPVIERAVRALSSS